MCTYTSTPGQALDEPREAECQCDLRTSLGLALSRQNRRHVLIRLWISATTILNFVMKWLGVEWTKHSLFCGLQWFVGADQSLLVPLPCRSGRAGLYPDPGSSRGGT
jgi:hypothetical protein